MSEEKGLADGSLGTFESVIMGIAGTAPAFSVAVTTASIVGAVGELAVGSILYCGLIMFGIMLAFTHLNKITRHAGATYAWVGKVFGQSWGFLAGWGLLIASIFFMVSATIPASTATLKILADIFGLAAEIVDDPDWVTLVAAIWLLLVTAVVTKGIKHASYAQLILTVIETVIIFALIIGAFVQYGGQPAHVPSLSWVSPFAFSAETFAQGALIAIFFYWGWDVTMNLGEETKGGTPEPAGQGAFWAMVNLILFFIIMMIVVLIVLTDEEIAAAQTNILYAIAFKLFPEPWAYFAVLSTILSTIGTIETQILQFSRSMFAMSRDKALHPVYSKIHPEWQTPWVATLVICFLGVFLLFASSKMPTVQAILDASIVAIGIQICFYMSLAAFACAWWYRGKLKSGFKEASSYVIWPTLSACFMVFMALYLSYTTLSNDDTEDNLAIYLGFAGLLIGLVPMYLGQLRRNRSAKLLN
ncbi:MAG: APC family permease [Formosimonas sp.]